MFVASIAAAALVGGAIGFGFGWKSGAKAGPVFDLFTAAQFSTYVSAIRHNGTPAAYEDALRSSISLNDQLRARDADPSNQRMYLFDKALDLVRLSELAKERGATEEASRLSAEVEALCPNTGIRDCSFRKLVGVASYIDSDFGMEPSAR